MAYRHAPALAAVVRAILHSLPTQFKRKRLNGPRQTLFVLLAAIQSGVDRIGVRSVRLELHKRFLKALGWAKKKPSTSAMCRALLKLKPDLLRGVIDLALSQVTKAYGKDLLVYGRRLVAIDGVRINAQRTTELARWFGLPKQADDKKAHQPQALVVIARCVITGVTLAEEIVRHTGSERACARKMIERLSRMGPMIILLDRGFPARDLIGLLLEYKLDFVVRMCGGKRAWNELRGNTTGSAKDQIISTRLRDGKGRWCSADLRIVMTVRAKAGRPRSNRTPQRMILLTNLKGKGWPTGRIVALYHRRWDIETSFREDKRLLGAAKSRAKTRNSFINELLSLHIYRIIMALLAALVIAEGIAPRWDDQRAKRINTCQLIIIAWWLVEVAMNHPRTCAKMIASMVHEIWRDADKKRPGRSFKRNTNGVEGAWKNKVERSQN